jgi:hypothetical protein
MELLQTPRTYHKMFVDMGILSAFAAILCKLSGLSTPRSSVTLSDSLESLNLKAFMQTVHPTPALLESFPVIMRLLAKVLELEENRRTFKHAHKGSLYEALRFPVLRPAVIHVLEVRCPPFHVVGHLMGC